MMGTVQKEIVVWVSTDFQQLTENKIFFSLSSFRG
jgi:hypothetical protein